ncbi:PREDICTED: telomerase reverse transcriptase isoform X2 [Lupinus angustifolius]|uniref:telomerase reverse transcriptase isoform X2 n=1 Tax=Lupinus angustifolius TaxID=3871 RepID=UPI00092EEBD8|nr:PREDICTED: telomerase reverse transcriptase isoform X2 [Lupinus angustifolius]
MGKKRMPHLPVPDVLWRLFRNRARTLSHTIQSILPPPPPSPELCRCRGRCCLRCTADRSSFLIRSDDSSDYRRLLNKCFIVVARNAPSLAIFSPYSNFPQNQIVKKTIEQMLSTKEPGYSNVLYSGYDRKKSSSPIVELLSCASWCLLLSRVGDDLMVYLLRNTSIFLPAPRGKHHQVGGPPINHLCFNMLKCSSKSGNQNPSLDKCGGQKRKRDGIDDLTTERQKYHISYSTNDPGSFVSSLGLTGEKSSLQLISHHGRRNYDSSVSEVPKSTKTDSVVQKSESEGKQGSVCFTPRLGKRSRPFRWQRQRCKKQQLNFEEKSLNMLPINKDGLHASFQCDNISLSIHEKLPWQCSCCLILQSLPTVPKRTNIKRQSIFYNLEPSFSVLPKKHILYSLRPNLACSKYLLGNIFGFSDVNPNAQSMHCLHSSGSCLIGSACLSHSLVKWFKNLIQRTKCCQHTKLLVKHCDGPSLDQCTSGTSTSRLKDGFSRTSADKKSQDYGTKYCADTVEAINSQLEAVKAYCSKSQVVSFIWAVSRSLLPSELLGTPSNWRIMRRNISKFIHLRRFEKFPLKLCMHELKTSRFPFLSNKYFLNREKPWVRNYMEGHSKVLHKEFRNHNSDVHGIKRKLLEKWMLWYFSNLVVPLIQSNFYVTESEQGKQDIYYYQKSVWEKLTNSTIACFKDWRYCGLNDVAVHNILRGRPFGFSKLRLQPKENGVRMVANLKCSSRLPLHISSMGFQYCKTERKAKHLKTKKEYFQSVNSALREAHTILKSIQFKDPEYLGSSVFDYNDVYKKLCPFLVHQKKGLTSMPNLFILTSDVLKAFDFVDQDKLLGIIKDVLLEDEYCLRQYDQVVCTKKSFWVQKQFKLVDETINTGHRQFTPFVSFRSQHAVFVNQERWKHVKKKVLFSYVTEHVKHNVLLFDGKFYLQGVGIPQGGVLSSLLCSLYYGHLERHVIFPYLEKTLESDSHKENNAVHTKSDDKDLSPCYMLLRFIDDFLFISTSKKQAEGLFSRLQRGFRGYNCYMNEKKFGANFDVEQISGPPLNRVYAGEDGTTSFLRWSGLLINCSTMEIQADYTKYLSNHLSSTLTVCWQGKPGIHLKEKLCLFLRPKCHPIFFDSNINSAAVVRLNTYQVFMLCAMKFHCYIRDLSFICKLHTRYCSDIIQRSLRYLHVLIKKRMHSMRFSSEIQPILKLEKEEVEWLGFHAFIQVLKRKESRHKELLAVLRSRLLSHRISGSVSPELKYAINFKNSSLLWDIKY